MKELTLKQIADWCGGTVAPEYETVPVTGVESDSRKVEVGDLFVALRGERVDGHDFIPSAKTLGAVAALVSRPSEELPCVVVESPLRAYGEIAKHYREMTGVKVVGITGSVGKTTTKEMIASVLSRDFKLYKSEGNHNNEIGLPMTVMNMPEDTELLVAELGTNHPGEIAYLSAIAQPDYAVITNIGIAHIEYLGSREGILREKLDILRSSLKNTVGIFNGDEPLLWDKRESLGCKVVTYGIENSACDLTADLHSDGTFDIVNNGLAAAHLPVGEKFTAKLSIPGKHNVLNALAAAAIGLLLGETPELIAQGLVSYQASGMRQNIYEQDGYQIYADCYNASPDAMEATLSVLGGMAGEGRRFAVLGSMLELGDYAEEGHRRAGRAAAQYADVLYAYGPDAAAMVAGAREKGMEHAYAFDDQTALVAALREDAKKGDALLFKGSRGMRMERALAMFLGEEVEA